MSMIKKKHNTKVCTLKLYYFDNILGHIDCEKFLTYLKIKINRLIYKFKNFK